MNLKKKPKIALALDNISDRERIRALINATSRSIEIYKIGLEQFVRFGPPILDLVRSVGKEIFLDLKLHDIPNTVAKAVHSACSLGVEYLTVHTSGGSAMMKAAAEAKRQHTDSKTAIIGVTLLTSIGEDVLHLELGVAMNPEKYVRHLVQLAVGSGMNGIVCSAADLSAVVPVLPETFEVITPGIRPEGTDANDQMRIATPVQAAQAGATILVIGRAITASPNPADAAQEIVAGLID